jgi:hypothetical protein
MQARFKRRGVLGLAGISRSKNQDEKSQSQNKGKTNGRKND